MIQLTTLHSERQGGKRRGDCTEKEKMYAEAGLLYPYFQNFPHELQQLQELCVSHRPSSSMSNVFPRFTISEYDLGGEGDLFKAPEAIIEEPVMSIDPVSAAISLMSCGGDDIMQAQAEALKVGDMEETLQNGQLLSDVFYECKKDILEKGSVEAAAAAAAVLQVVPNTMLPPLPEENEIQVDDSKLLPPPQKSVSSGCLTTMDWVVNPTSIRPSFLDFSELNFDGAYGMRRSYSEGDIETLGNGNIISLIPYPHPIQRPLVIGSSSTSEDRMQKLSRYRNKKSRRNFGRKIKPAL
ncbi:hypothetical protein Dimus_000147 [Dionaea muscipula]